MTYPCCSGACDQGRGKCDCDCTAGDRWIIRISLVGSAVIIILIALELL